MAVVISSKFYQASAWKDISKIVFTSPNMDSPATAGTRSHILPGEGNLATWYEDTASMYRIEDHQWTTDSDFYNYRMECVEDTDLTLASGFIDVKNVNNANFDTFVVDNCGVDPVGFKDVTHLIVDYSTVMEYTPYQNEYTYIHYNGSNDNKYQTFGGDHTTCNYLVGGEIKTVDVCTDISIISKQPCWYTSVVLPSTACYIIFEFQHPIILKRLYMSGVVSKSIQAGVSFSGDFCSNPESLLSVSDGAIVTQDNVPSITLYPGNNGTTWSGSMATSTIGIAGTTLFIDSNTTAYKYYKLTFATGVNYKNYVTNLRFYTYDYSTLAGSDNLAVYEFEDYDDPKVLRISNAYYIQSTTPTVSSGIEYVENIKGILYLLSGDLYYCMYSSDDSENFFFSNFTSEDDFKNMVDKSNNIGVDISTTINYTNTNLSTDTATISGVGSITIPVNTIDLLGEVITTYVVDASGTVISGSNPSSTAMYYMEGTITRNTVTTTYDRYDKCRLVVDEYTTNSGIIEKDTPIYAWGGYESSDRPLDIDVQNSIVFEVTNGEAYDCRLTAWDDATHSTTLNELIQGDHVRCSAMTYCSTGSKLSPTESNDPMNLVYPPVHNRIFKGNTVDGDYKYYYGDFNMIYRYQSTIYGDYLIFKPMLYGIDSSISYGVHDFVITLSYSYT